MYYNIQVTCLYWLVVWAIPDWRREKTLAGFKPATLETQAVYFTTLPQSHSTRYFFHLLPHSFSSQVWKDCGGLLAQQLSNKLQMALKQRLLLQQRFRRVHTCKVHINDFIRHILNYRGKHGIKKTHWSVMHKSPETCGVGIAQWWRSRFSSHRPGFESRFQSFFPREEILWCCLANQQRTA